MNGPPPGSVLLASRGRMRQTHVLYHSGVIYISCPSYGTTFTCSVADVFGCRKRSMRGFLFSKLPIDLLELVESFLGEPVDVAIRNIKHSLAYAIAVPWPGVLRCRLTPVEKTQQYNDHYPYYPTITPVYFEPMYPSRHPPHLFMLDFPREAEEDGTREAVFVDPANPEAWLRFNIPDDFLQKRAPAAAPASSGSH